MGANGEVITGLAFAGQIETALSSQIGTIRLL